MSNKLDMDYGKLERSLLNLEEYIAKIDTENKAELNWLLFDIKVTSGYFEHAIRMCK